MKKLLLLTGVFAIAAMTFTGCASSPASSKFSMTYMGQEVTFESPKDYNITGLDAEITTNGIARMKIQSLTSTLSTNVAPTVSAEYQGMVDLANAVGSQVNNATSQALGAIAKGAVQGAK